MRHAYPMIGGDRDTQDAYEAECERARASQVSRYAVAPRQQVKTHDECMLTAGMRVTLDCFRYVPSQRVERDGTHSLTEALPPWRQLERLVERGVVLENYNIPGEGS